MLCQDWHDADDLVQAAAGRLFTHWPRAARMDNVDGYVRTILVRTFLSERRSPWFRRVQAAIALGCSTGTVKSQTAKGLAAMRRVLEPAWDSGTGRADGYPARGQAERTRRGT
jgi:DNA-directed RNA polymerase specialized sigma24 family protein